MTFKPFRFKNKEQAEKFIKECRSFSPAMEREIKRFLRLGDDYPFRGGDEK